MGKSDTNGDKIYFIIIVSELLFNSKILAFLFLMDFHHFAATERTVKGRMLTIIFVFDGFSSLCSPRKDSEFSTKEKGSTIAMFSREKSEIGIH
jgi:hypothetical protein